MTNIHVPHWRIKTQICVLVNAQCSNSHSYTSHKSQSRKSQVRQVLWHWVGHGYLVAVMGSKSSKWLLRGLRLYVPLFLQKITLGSNSSETDFCEGVTVAVFFNFTQRMKNVVNVIYNGHVNKAVKNDPMLIQQLIEVRIEFLIWNEFVHIKTFQALGTWFRSLIWKSVAFTGY